MQPILGTGFTLEVRKLRIREVKHIAPGYPDIQDPGLQSLSHKSRHQPPPHVASSAVRGEANEPYAELCLQGVKAGSGDGHKTGISFIELWTFLLSGAREGDRGRKESARS